MQHGKGKNEKNKIYRIIFLILIIINCATIFHFSSQNGDISGNTSGTVIKKVLNIFSKYKNLKEEEQIETIEKLQPFVRKMAHFSIYTLLGFNLMGFFKTLKIQKKSKIALSAILGVLYAISDEIHQMFSAGRTARIFDVGVDTCGVIFGILIIIILSKIIQKEKQRGKIHVRKTLNK